MDTFYAPAERTDPATLNDEITIVTGSPVMEGLLQTVGGLLAVVNEQRQVVAFNSALLDMLGVEDPQSVLGMRPGEILSCVYSADEPAGCGTTKMCSTCGAAIAMVTSFETDSCSERLCALKTVSNGKPGELALSIRSQPIRIDGRRFLLLFLQDVTRQEFQASLERTFFHDIHNTLQILVGMSDLLMDGQPSEEVLTIQKTTQRLLHEVALQKRLMDGTSAHYTAYLTSIDAVEVFDELREEMEKHPVAVGKTLSFQPEIKFFSVKTDRPMLTRILTNMIINACEATPSGGTVKLGIARGAKTVELTVWNSGMIAPDIAARIFQRHFSTKNQPGRGLGTYSMKLFGEKYLRGKVQFSSTEEDGTEFRLSLPV